MKKLLALILCVMMFVSVIPTSAFAGGAAVDNPLYSASEYAEQIKNMIKNTKSNIEKSYKFLAADQVVYGSAKAMDDIIVGLVDGIGDTLIEKNLMKKAGVDAVKDNVRSYIDGAVADKISENYYKALDKDGKRDPILYAQLVADSIQGALTDKDFQKGYEAVATYWALASLIKDTRDSLKDARKDFAASVDKKFQADFAKKYTALVDEYIDTFDTAAAKALSNEVAQYALDALMLPVENAHTTGTKAANDTYKATATDLANVKKAADKATATDLAVADAKFDLAQAVYDRIMNSTTADADTKKQAIEAYAAAVDAYAQAQKDYEAGMKANQKAYDDGIKEAQKTRDEQLLTADTTYLQDASKAHTEWAGEYEFVDIYPWATSPYYGIPSVGSWISDN
jgi:hypothetical protein